MLFKYIIYFHVHDVIMVEIYDINNKSFSGGYVGLVRIENKRCVYNSAYGYDNGIYIDSEGIKKDIPFINTKITRRR